MSQNVSRQVWLCLVRLKIDQVGLGQLRLGQLVLGYVVPFFQILAHSLQWRDREVGLNIIYLRKLFIDIIIRVNNMLLIPFLVLFHSQVVGSKADFLANRLESQLASKSCAAINSLHNRHVNHNVQVDLPTHTQLNYVTNTKYLLFTWYVPSRYLYSHLSEWIHFYIH